LDAEPLLAGASDIVNLGGRWARKTAAWNRRRQCRKYRDRRDCQFPIFNCQLGRRTVLSIGNWRSEIGYL